MVQAQNHACRIKKADLRSYLWQGDCPLNLHLHESVLGTWQLDWMFREMRGWFFLAVRSPLSSCGFKRKPRATPRRCTDGSQPFFPPTEKLEIGTPPGHMRPRAMVARRYSMISHPKSAHSTFLGFLFFFFGGGGCLFVCLGVPFWLVDWLVGWLIG